MGRLLLSAGREGGEPGSERGEGRNGVPGQPARQDRRDAGRRFTTLPPLGHGVGVRRVINAVVVLIWGHDACGEGKGTLQTAEQLRAGTALCPHRGGTGHGTPRVRFCPPAAVGPHGHPGAALSRTRLGLVKEK